MEIVLFRYVENLEHETTILFNPTLFFRSPNFKNVYGAATIEHVSRSDAQQCVGREDERNRADRVEKSESSFFLARNALEIQWNNSEKVHGRKMTG